MLAVDTNIIVRYLTRDDEGQATRARSLIDDNDVFVCTTVLLETEWVLRGAYRLSRRHIAEALGAFARLPRVNLENPAIAGTALNWFTHGMDFADALHLAGTAHCEAFVSFDRPLGRLAQRVARLTVRVP
jgi:predicted nucleic-acid-binding protein